MDTLLNFQDILLQSVTNDFRRYLHEKINWNQRMIGIKGSRGAGKTTLLLQHLRLVKTLLSLVLSGLSCYKMRLYTGGADMYSVLTVPARDISVLRRAETALTLAWSVLSLAEFILQLDLSVLYSVEAVNYIAVNTMYRRKMRFFSVNFHLLFFFKG